MTGWRQLEWGDIATLEYGKALRDYRDGRGSVIVYGTNGPIGSIEGPAHSDSPGVIVGRKGAYRGIHYAGGPFAVIDTAFWLRPLEPVDLRWAYYELLTHDINSMDSGSAIPSTSRDAFYRMPVLVPPIEDQQAIAAVLGALDDKIESNRRAQEISLQLAAMHYARVSESVGRVRLGDLANLVLGGTPDRARPEYWREGSIPWINSGAANQDIILEPSELITEAALNNSAAKLMPVGATVIAITGATLGQVALLAIETSGNQSLVGVWAEEGALTAWLHFAIRDSIDDLVKTATGAAQQHVNKANISALEVHVPTGPQLADWASAALPLVRRSVQLASESKMLRGLRDASLPELLSGRIRVPVEAV